EQDARVALVGRFERERDLLAGEWREVDVERVDLRRIADRQRAQLRPLALAGDRDREVDRRLGEAGDAGEEARLLRRDQRVAQSRRRVEVHALMENAAALERRRRGGRLGVLDLAVEDVHELDVEGDALLLLLGRDQDEDRDRGEVLDALRLAEVGEAAEEVAAELRLAARAHDRVPVAVALDLRDGIAQQRARVEVDVTVRGDADAADVHDDLAARRRRSRRGRGGAAGRRRLLPRRWTGAVVHGRGGGGRGGGRGGRRGIPRSGSRCGRRGRSWSRRSRGRALVGGLGEPRDREEGLRLRTRTATSEAAERREHRVDLLLEVRLRDDGDLLHVARADVD